MHIRTIAAEIGILTGAVIEKMQVSMGNTDWLAALLTVVIAVLAGGVSYGILRSKVDENAKDVEELKERAEKHDQLLAHMAGAVSELVGEARERRRGRLRTRSEDTDEYTSPT